MHSVMADSNFHPGFVIDVLRDAGIRALVAAGQEIVVHATIPGELLKRLLSEIHPLRFALRPSELLRPFFPVFRVSSQPPCGPNSKNNAAAWSLL